MVQEVLHQPHDAVHLLCSAHADISWIELTGVTGRVVIICSKVS